MNDHPRGPKRPPTTLQNAKTVINIPNKINGAPEDVDTSTGLGVGRLHCKDPPPIPHEGGKRKPATSRVCQDKGRKAGLEGIISASDR